MKAAQIVVAVAFEELFIKSVTKQQISAAAKSLLPRNQTKQLKGAEKSKFLPPLAKAFLENKIVKVKKGVAMEKITRDDVKKVKTF